MSAPYPPEELPAHDKLADANDVLGWDRTVHGRMLDHADDIPPETVPYDPATDPFLVGEG